jgi:hypothetical protein
LDEFKEQFKATIKAETQGAPDQEEERDKDQARSTGQKAEAKNDTSAHPPQQTPEKVNAPAK